MDRRRRWNTNGQRGEEGEERRQLEEAVTLTAWSGRQQEVKTLNFDERRGGNRSVTDG